MVHFSPLAPALPLLLCRGDVRHHYTHAILKGTVPWQSFSVKKGRRVSVLLRELRDTVGPSTYSN
jgi:hypothetical protein